MQPTPLPRNKYDPQTGDYLGLRPTKAEANQQKHGLGGGLGDTWSYQAGRLMRPLFNVHGYPARAFNHPVTGALALGIPAILGGLGLGKPYDRLAPYEMRANLPIQPSRLATLLGLGGAGLGAYLGNTRRGYLQKAGSAWPSMGGLPFPQPPMSSLSVPAFGMLPQPSWPMLVPLPVGAPPQLATGGSSDPFQEITQAIQQSQLPPMLQVKALSAVPELQPTEANALAGVVGGVSGALAGAVVLKFLTDKGLLAPLGGAMMGGLLGRQLGRSL